MIVLCQFHDKHVRVTKFVLCLRNRNRNTERTCVTVVSIHWRCIELSDVVP